MDASVKRGHDAAESGAKDRTILAGLGATPVFSEAIHVGRPNIGNRQRFLERIETMLDRRYLTNSGPFERELEQRLSGMRGVRYCGGVGNRTGGREIAIRS